MKRNDTNDSNPEAGLPAQPARDAEHPRL